MEWSILEGGKQSKANRKKHCFLKTETY